MFKNLFFTFVAFVAVLKGSLATENSLRTLKSSSNIPDESALSLAKETRDSLTKIDDKTLKEIASYLPEEGDQGRERLFLNKGGIGGGGGGGFLQRVAGLCSLFNTLNSLSVLGFVPPALLQSACPDSLLNGGTCSQGDAAQQAAISCAAIGIVENAGGILGGCSTACQSYYELVCAACDP